ncbi:MAG TPA: hypothetical protein VM451_04375 [Candidatus Limnocylindria bacterium]|nr:hypothetical protein [Candidatus Limnocylindria bacterium]
MTGLKPRLVALFGAGALCLAIAGPAFAGEVTGNGKPTAGPAHANSACVYSGKNDDPSAPLSGTANIGGVSQSYGQLNRRGVLWDLFGVTPKQFNPGDACRGGSNEEPT